MRSREQTIVKGEFIRIGQIDSNGNVLTEEMLKKLMLEGGLTVNIGGVAMAAQFEFTHEGEPPLMPTRVPMLLQTETGTMYSTINGIRVYQSKPRRSERLYMAWKGIRFSWCDDSCNECGSIK